MKRLALLISAVSGLALASAANAQTVLKAGHGAQTGHPSHLALVKLGEILASKTGGKVKIEVYPDRQLGEEREMVEGLQLGTVDMAVISSGPLPAFVPARGRVRGRVIRALQRAVQRRLDRHAF